MLYCKQIFNHSIDQAYSNFNSIVAKTANNKELSYKNNSFFCAPAKPGIISRIIHWIICFESASKINTDARERFHKTIKCAFGREVSKYIHDHGICDIYSKKPLGAREIKRAARFVYSNKALTLLKKDCEKQRATIEEKLANLLQINKAIASSKIVQWGMNDTLSYRKKLYETLLESMIYTYSADISKQEKLADTLLKISIPS